MPRVRRTAGRDGILHSHRKVGRVGSSLFVTLPIAWVRRQGVKSGDVLAVVAGGSLLAVSPVPENREVSSD